MSRQAMPSERVVCTLMVERLVNLTDKKISIYDWQGDLNDFLPNRLNIVGGRLPEPTASSYYVVDNSTSVLPLLKSDLRYYGLLLEPLYCGKNAGGKDVYRLRVPYGYTRVVLQGKMTLVKS